MTGEQKIAEASMDRTTKEQQVANNKGERHVKQQSHGSNNGRSNKPRNGNNNTYPKAVFANNEY